jgi:hypothetical protein
MTDDELQQYWDARPFMAERIAEYFAWDWPPMAVVDMSGEPLEAVRWVYEKLRCSEGAILLGFYE